MPPGIPVGIVAYDSPCWCGDITVGAVATSSVTTAVITKWIRVK
jgi:hypothetical protein